MRLFEARQLLRSCLIPGKIQVALSASHGSGSPLSSKRATVPLTRLKLASSAGIRDFTISNHCVSAKPPRFKVVCLKSAVIHATFHVRAETRM